MKISELVGHQIEFETTRVGNSPVGGMLSQTLWEHNSYPGNRVRRLQQEVDELKIADDLDLGDFRKLAEAADIIIFTSGIMAELCVKNGWPLTYADLIIRDKMKQNFQKYTEANFVGKTVAEGLIYSREKWVNEGGSS